MAADEDDMQWLEDPLFPSDYEFSEEERLWNSRKVKAKPEHQLQGRKFPVNVIQGQKFEYEVSRDRCLSPRRSANNTIWKSMQMTSGKTARQPTKLADGQFVLIGLNG